MAATKKTAAKRTSKKKKQEQSTFWLINEIKYGFIRKPLAIFRTLDEVNDQLNLLEKDRPVYVRYEVSTISLGGI